MLLVLRRLRRLYLWIEQYTTLRCRGALRWPPRARRWSAPIWPPAAALRRSSTAPRRQQSCDVDSARAEEGAAPTASYPVQFGGVTVEEVGCIAREAQERAERETLQLVQSQA